MCRQPSIPFPPTCTSYPLTRPVLRFYKRKKIQQFCLFNITT
jgi:hypothetical protein